MSRPRYLTTLTTRRGFDSSLILFFSSETDKIQKMAQRDLTSNQRLCLMAAIAFVSKFNQRCFTLDGRKIDGGKSINYYRDRKESLYR